MNRVRFEYLQSYVAKHISCSVDYIDVIKIAHQTKVI